MRETKPNILSAALKLFNEKGFVNVRLQHIADEANVSVGNLAYHFATKKDVLKNVYKQIVTKQVELLNELNIVPLFENLDHHWENVFETQSNYQFFYQDTLEIIRYDESIADGYRKHIRWEKEQYFRIIQFNISRGALVALDNEEEGKQLAEQIWLLENSWWNNCTISGREPTKVNDFKSHMWQSFLPYFSQIGKQEYQQLITKQASPF